jgi:hypothetical protein
VEFDQLSGYVRKAFDREGCSQEKSDGLNSILENLGMKRLELFKSSSESLNKHLSGGDIIDGATEWVSRLKKK